ncbi:MAG TPA: beta-galactosidase, partial [Flavitalea sp.]|nr:beta-galactosidase [Flavitalea sp.]
MKDLIIILVACLFFSCNRSGSSIQQIDLSTQWDSTRVLKNPDKGWYHHLLDNGVSKYAIANDSIFRSFPGMDHLYLRLAWSYLEPQEGQYDWHRIDEVIKKYVPLGYGISFRISCKETGLYPGRTGQELNGVQYSTPIWVQRAGAKGVVAVNDGIKSWTPKWDDPVYLEKLDRFHKAFAARYDGQPWLRYVDVGSIGDWGEGHTSFSTKVPPTVAEVKANINVYLKNYKKSQLVCTDDLFWSGKTAADMMALFDYAVANG